jgi:hypothetical protein
VDEHRGSPRGIDHLNPRNRLRHRSFSRASMTRVRAETHPTAITRLMVLLVLSLSALAGGCGRETEGEPRRGSDAAPVPGTVGVWEWVRSTGGSLGDTITAGTRGRRYRLAILDGERYRQTSSVDGVSEGTYTSASSYTFEQPDVIAPVLRFDQPLSNGWFGPEGEYAVFIRGDTLELKETHSHPWAHQFLRVPQETVVMEGESSGEDNPD